MLFIPTFDPDLSSNAYSFALIINDLVGCTKSPTRQIDDFFVLRTTNNNIGRNLFDLFSTHDLVIFFQDLIISTQDLEVKSAFSS